MAKVTGPRPYTGSAIAIDGITYTFEITSVTHTDTNRVSLDITHTLSPDNAMQFMPGDLLDAGTLEITGNFDPNEWANLLTALGAQPANVTHTYGIRPTETTAASWQCSGFMTTKTEEGTNEEVITATLTIKLTGKITPTEAA